jgi:ABC-2 type transport system permease protein
MVAVAPALRTLPPGRYRFSGALRAEWTKLRSVRSTAWCLLATVVAGIGIGILATATEASHWRNADVIDKALFDPTSISLTGLVFGQLAIGVLGVLTMSAEYGSGSIRATFAAIPRRPLVLAAKAAVFGVVALVLAEAVSFTAFFVGQAILSGSTPTATLSGHNVLRAVIGGGVYLTLLGLIALGIAAMIRHTAGAITTFVSILLILPLIVAAFPASIGHPIGRYLPATIGNAMTSTSYRGAHVDFLPAFPFWHGFAILCAYAVGALVIGGVLMVRRDP